MTIAEHRSESFAPFDRGMRRANVGQWLQQAILKSLMSPRAIGMPEEDHRTQPSFVMLGRHP